MRPVRRAILPFSLSFLAGVVGICGVARAQSQNSPGDGAKKTDASRPQRPVHKLNEVPTTDSVVLLGVKRAGTGAVESVGGAQNGAGPAQAASAPKLNIPVAATDDPEKKAAEIASLQKQIQDKMKRITFLMRLFVDDEKAFIVDPANPKGDGASQERRKYEQDELLWETAELARLKARLNEITAAR